MNSTKYSKKRVQTASSTSDVRTSLAKASLSRVTNGELPGAMGRTEIARHSDPSILYARACDTTAKLVNLVQRLESVHTSLYGGRLSDANSEGADVSTTGLFGLLKEETDKHTTTLAELDCVLTSLEYRTGLTQIDRTPFLNIGDGDQSAVDLD